MPTYMRKNEHGYRFVRVIPKELTPYFDKVNFIYSLGRDYKAAKAACVARTAETEQKLTEARERHAQLSAIEAYFQRPHSERLRKISLSKDLAGQLASLYLSSLCNDAEARAEGLDDEAFDALNDNIREMRPLIDRALATGQVDSFHGAIHQLLAGRGYELKATDKEWQRLTYTVLQHLQDGYEILAQRQKGRQLGSANISDLPAPLPAAWELSASLGQTASTTRTDTTRSTVKRMSDVTPEYEKYLSTTSQKSRTTYLSIWQRFVTYTKDKPLEEVKSGDVYNFMKERLEAADKPWSQSYTSGRVKRVLHDAFALATTLNFTSKNPLTKLRVLPKISEADESSRRKPRYPYKSEHLNKLFTSDWYNPNSALWRGKMKDDLGARYWIPLLCMWHGFRVSEATQLQIHDIDLDNDLIKIQVSQDEFCEAEDVKGIRLNRSLKNAATRRIIPIHPALIELGFLDFVRMIMNQYAKGPLFPSALPDPDSMSPKWGRAYEQSFLRFMRDRLELGSGYGNHSFRHALEDRIRESNADAIWPEGMGRSYTGRASIREQDRGFLPMEGSEIGYGDGYSPDNMLRYIKRIEYREVKLPPPFASWLGNQQVINKRLIAQMKHWRY